MKNTKLISKIVFFLFLFPIYSNTPGITKAIMIVVVQFFVCLFTVDMFQIKTNWSEKTISLKWDIFLFLTEKITNDIRK